MDFTSQIGIFLLGFLLGAGIIAIFAWYINIRKLQQVKNPANELLALKTEMQSIHSTIEQFSIAQAKKEGAFAAHVQNFLVASEKINATADRFSNTLIRGGSQQQGTWGEFILSNILEAIGFPEGEEYDTQKGFKKADGKIQKPDVIIHMPGKRDIIIDSKVSLLAWDDYTNAIDEESKAQALKRHIESIKKFIKDLNTDNYSKLYKIDTVDSILMFMPVEPAYHVLAKEGKSIIEEALKKWFSNKSMAEAVDILSENSIPCSPVNNVEQASNDPHLREREMMVEVPDPIAGTMWVTGKSIKFSRTPMVVGATPKVGEHTNEILSEVLGYSNDEIQKLVEKEIIRLA